jgi:hypothetical protein
MPFLILFMACGPGPDAMANVVSENTFLWMRGYDDVAHRDDRALAVSIDAAGNIYVAGTETRSDLGEDNNILLIKYSPAGDVLWSRSHSGIPNGEDIAGGVAAIPAGGAYVAGWETKIGGARHAWIRKYGADGSILGTTTYDAPGVTESYFFSVALDASGGRVYAVGIRNPYSAGSYGEWLLVKYDLDLNPQWVRTFVGTGWGFSEAWGVAVAANGDAVVAGYETIDDPSGLLPGKDWFERKAILRDYSNPMNTDALLRRYTPAGVLVWSSRYGSDPSVTDYKQDAYFGVSLDSAGWIYPVGVCEPVQPSDSKTDRLLRKYTGDGQTVAWSENVAVITSRDDSAEACVVSQPGKLVVAGASLSPDFGRDVYIEAYETGTGNNIFRTGYDSGAFVSKNNDFPTGVASDSSGNYVIVGYENRTSDLHESYNWFVRKYSGPVPVPVSLSNTKVFPNPFNPATAVGGTLKFAPIPRGAKVAIFTVRGYRVRELAETGFEAAWDGTNDHGAKAGAGVYVYTISAPGVKTIRGRVMLVRP